MTLKSGECGRCIVSRHAFLYNREDRGVLNDFCCECQHKVVQPCETLRCKRTCLVSITSDVKLCKRCKGTDNVENNLNNANSAGESSQLESKKKKLR